MTPGAFCLILILTLSMVLNLFQWRLHEDERILLSTDLRVYPEVQLLDNQFHLDYENQTIQEWKEAK